MKHKKAFFVVIIIFLLLFSAEVFAVTESEVQAQVDSAGREAVSGNVFIWFICAIAFLKVSQKIDSFMSSIGVNVGHTGGSMMAEAIIAAKSLSTAKGIVSGGSHAGRASSSSSFGSSGRTAAKGFLSGGLAGVVSRQLASSAVEKATGNGSGGIGGQVFVSSMGKGGDFANNVISTVAKGNINTVGTITGENAEKAMISYMGYAGMENENIPKYSNVEIGGGRITGTETTAENPNGAVFSMYNTEQYIEPKGEYTTVTSVDGSKWYKQYAADTAEKTPYMAPDGSIAYREAMVKRLPDPPRRKDRI